MGRSLSQTAQLFWLRMGPKVAQFCASPMAFVRAMPPVTLAWCTLLSAALVLALTSVVDIAWTMRTHHNDAGFFLVGDNAMPLPHGPTQTLVDLLVSPERRQLLESDIASGAVEFTWTLTQRQACDIELLLNGGFTPLRGFMTRGVYYRVTNQMRLGKGKAGTPDAADSTGASDAGGLSWEAYGDALWPMPITLDVPADLAEQARAGSRIALRDSFFNLIAVITVSDVWRPDKLAEAQAVFGTTDTSHPGVAYLLQQAHDWYIGGELEGIALPQHFDHNSMRMTPAQVRADITRRGWKRTVAFQTRNPMHRAHIELTRLAGISAKAGVLLHPVVGMTKPGDVEASVRVRCVQAVAQSGRYHAKGGVMLALLPLAMRMGGPREALWHAIIRKNHGASHFIVGRDHAGVKSAAGKDFYGAYDAQTLVLKHAAELGVSIQTFQEVEYVPELKAFLPGDQIPAGSKTLSISGTKFRAMMAKGDPIPEWYSDPAVIAILREFTPPTHKRGFTIFFTGLSGGGKTTISHALMQRLGDLLPTRRLTVLDGDVVRTHLSKGLGFSLNDRNANIERIGFVAGEAVKHGGIVIAAPIAPFDSSRRMARKLVTEAGGGFLQVHTATRIGECANRDVKGLYESAGYGTVNAAGVPDVSAVKFDLTGVSHPFEMPDAPDLTIRTEEVPVADAAAIIIAKLVQLGYILPEGLSAAERELVHALAADSKGEGKAAPPASTALVPAGEAPSAFIKKLANNDAELRAVFSAGVPDASAEMCSADWDQLTVPNSAGGVGGWVTTFGGLPMAGSPTSKQWAAATASFQVPAGSVFAPARVIIGLAHGAQAGLLRDVLNSALGKSLSAAGGVNAQRIAVSEAAAAAETGDKKQAAAAAAAADAAGIALGADLKAGLGDASLTTGLPGSSKLNEAGRLYAGYDLWAAIRWFMAPSSKAGGSTVAAIHPRLIVFVQHMLRLDPCLRVAVLLPGTAGVAENDKADAEALAALLGTSPAYTGNTKETLQSYAAGYVRAVRALAAAFPDRVVILQAPAGAAPDVQVPQLVSQLQESGFA